MKNNKFLITIMALMALTVAGCNRNTSSVDSNIDVVSLEPTSVEPTSLEPTSQEESANSVETSVQGSQESTHSETSTPSSSTPITETHTVYFTRGGEEVLPSQEVNDGQTVNNPGAPSTNDGKTFKYWADMDGNQFDFSTPITEDTYLDAIFRYIIQFDANGGVGTAPKTQEYVISRSIVLPANPFTKTGFDFVGWDDGVSTYQANDTYMITKSVTFKALWEANGEPGDVSTAFNVTYKPGEHGIGSDITDKTSEDGSVILRSSSTFAAEEGYAFDKWVDEKNTSLTYEASSLQTFSSSKVLVATWIETGADATAMNFYDRDYSSGLYFPSTKEGNHTGGLFYSESIEVSFYYTIEGNIVKFSLAGQSYSATFSEAGIDVVISYGLTNYVYQSSAQEDNPPTVNFSANGGSGIAPTYEITKISSGYKIVLPQNTYDAPANKKFAYWDVNGDKRNPGEEYIAQANEVINIKAIWESTSLFDIQIDENNQMRLVKYNGDEETIVIPEDLGIEAIAMNAFASCTKVKTIDFASTVKYLATGCLTRAPSTLTTIILRSETEVNASSAYTASPITGPVKKLIVKAPASLLSVDEDGNVIYGSGEMSIALYTFQPIEEDININADYDRISISDLVGKTFISETGFRFGTSTYTKIEVSYDSNFGTNKLRIYYTTSSGSTSSTSFLEDEGKWSINTETNEITMENAYGYFITFGYKDGVLTVTYYSTKTSSVSGSFEFIEQ